MHTVLVVENNPTIQRILVIHLESEGCKVITADNGLDALVILEDLTPDIIFSDIIMPKVSGDQLCNIIRKNPKLKDIFIAVHSSATLEGNSQLLSIDADAFIAKGPTTNIKGHLQHVLGQFKKGKRRDTSIIGKTDLYPREITRELLLARQHYQAIFDNVAEAVVEMDSNGQIIQANIAARKTIGLELPHLLSSNFTSYLQEPEKSFVSKWIDSFQTTGQLNYTTDYDAPISINGHSVIANLTAIKEQENYFIIGTFQDITHQKETEANLARIIGEFNAVIDTIDYGILFVDRNLKARIVNNAYRDMWNVPHDFIAEGKTMEEFMLLNRGKNLYDMPAEEFERYMRERIKAIKQSLITPTELKRSDGKVFQFQCVELPDDGRMLTYFDITALKVTEEKLEEALTKVNNLANHDPLTGLPNLRLARERMLSAISLSRRKGWKAAIMFVDLDGFKDINDNHGHETGDILLKLVADRLTESLRETDTVARIGGDEFLVIQTEVPHRYAAANVAEKIVKNIGMPFHIEGLEIQIGASIGIAIYPEHGDNSSVLLKKADNAMYYTKKIGKNNYTFTPE